MRPHVRETGEYELFEAKGGRRVLVLDGKDWFAWQDRGGAGEIGRVEPAYDKNQILGNGEYFLVEFEGAGPAEDASHLFLQTEDGFLELVLPEGLPASATAARPVRALGGEERARTLRQQMTGR